MNDAEITFEAANAIRAIHVITGWDLPGDMDYMRILTEQLVLKIKEDYSHLNFLEIKAAFRKNGLGIIDWGKSMNLDLICRVLNDYAAERYDAGIIEEKSKQPPPEIIYTEDELDNMQRQWTEEFYQRIRKGNLEPVPVCVSKILLKDGIIKDKKDTEDYLVWALNNGLTNIYIKED